MSESKRSVLIVGSGGREHALAWTLARQGNASRIMVAPGNAGIAEIAECFAVKATDLDAQVELAKREEPDLVLVAPDDPLALGLVDRLQDEGFRAFGPSAAAARIESSKAFSKALMAKYGVPTAAFKTFDDAGKAADYIRAVDHRVVVKASGLAAGKGAIVTETKEEALAAIDEIMVRREFGEAGDQVVIEEFMTGEEASLFAICDGTNFRTFVPAQDHKPALDGDKGPNTGGMGAYTTAPVLTQALIDESCETIIKPTLKGMRQEGCPYHGMLYVGLMITDEGPKVVEMNARWGDPEAQVILPRLKTDMLALMDASIDGTLDKIEVEEEPGAAVVVMLTSPGYPGKYPKGLPISGLEKADAHEGVIVFHSGTVRDGDRWLTNGGRVLGVTALADDIPGAIERAYAAANEISWDGIHYRRDIGAKAAKYLSD
jgi:phosphoribosylamine---glycine ligase